MKRVFLALVVLVAAIPALAGVGRMDSKPLWDLADHGGPMPIDWAHFVEIPNSCLPDSYAFTVEATYRFDDMSDEAVVNLLDCTVGETGFGAYCDTVRLSGKTMKLRVNGETYGGSGVWFLGGHKDGKAWWKPNGTELKLTISARKGWISVYQDDVLQKSYMMQVTPNLAPIRAGGEAYARDKSKLPDMKGVTLLSLRIWDGLEEYRGIGEPEKKETGFAAGKGWQVRVPVEPLRGKPNVFYYGDSISVGYTKPLTDLTKGKANLYHWMSCLYEPGAEGVDVRKFREIGKLADYDYVVFNNGGHSAHWTSDKVTDAQVRASYRALVAAMRELAPHAKMLVYVMTTPRTRINGESEEKIAKLLKENVTIERLNRIAREVMDAEGVTVLDFYSRFQARSDYWAGDGYHFRPPAYAEIAQAICAEVLSKAKFVWIELLGFDNTKPDFGVGDWLKRQTVKPQVVSLLLEDVEFLHAHAGLAKDFGLPDSVCSYGARPGNEERRRQKWRAWQLRGLVAELKRRGLDVFPSFFERGLFDVTRTERDGGPYVDFFIRQTLAFLKDYGFTGLHAADGFGHPRYGIDTWFRAGYRPDGRKVRFARDEGDWRRAAEDWTAFWRKASAALKREGYKVYLNTVWTRDPYEALVRYGMDYAALCETDIDGFICESSASVLELEGWNWDEESTLDKSLAMLNRIAACVKGRKELLLLHCIKDGCEQYNALRHAPMRAVAEAIATGAVRTGSKRALCGEMECLADGISAAEWKLLDGAWDLAFAGEGAAAEGVRVVWSDRGLRNEAETMPRLECASSSTLLALLYHRGAALGGLIDVKEALADKSLPLVILNPATLPEDELAALRDRPAQVIELGHGIDEFPVEPTWERKLVWPFPMYERRPAPEAVNRAVTAINALSPLKPMKSSAGAVSVMSARQADGTRFVVLRNLTSHYHTAWLAVPDDVREATALTADPMLPVTIAADKEGVRVMTAKLPPDGVVLIKTGGFSTDRKGDMK